MQTVGADVENPKEEDPGLIAHRTPGAAAETEEEEEASGQPGAVAGEDSPLMVASTTEAAPSLHTVPESVDDLALTGGSAPPDAPTHSVVAEFTADESWQVTVSAGDKVSLVADDGNGWSEVRVLYGADGAPKSARGHCPTSYLVRSGTEPTQQTGGAGDAPLHVDTDEGEKRLSPGRPAEELPAPPSDAAAAMAAAASAPPAAPSATSSVLAPAGTQHAVEF